MSEYWTMKVDRNNQLRQNPDFDLWDDNGCYLGSFRSLIRRRKTIVTAKPTQRSRLPPPICLMVLADLVRYHTDEEWRDEQESHANKVTDGNVTFLDALIDKAKDAIAKAEPHG